MFNRTAMLSVADNLSFGGASRRVQPNSNADNLILGGASRHVQPNSVANLSITCLKGLVKIFMAGFFWGQSFFNGDRASSTGTELSQGPQKGYADYHE
ncbi:MAG: hypothetical protein LBH73_06995 [Spirochaetaceae bacterium]|jgi:hypothetical protein|nr:hypothetical protein [Spirochaetaceae bacterium]